MKHFKEYLKEKRLPAETIRSHCKSAEAFQEWVDQRRMPIENIRQADLMRYMRRCEKRVHSKEKLRLKFLALRHYLNYMIDLGRVQYNPVRGVYVMRSNDVMKRTERHTHKEPLIAYMF